MKSKDIALLIVIAVISAAVSFMVSGLIISSDDKKQTVEVIEPISPNFDRPSKAYFNDNSINPTQEIRIQEDPGSNPFGEE